MDVFLSKKLKYLTKMRIYPCYAFFTREKIHFKELRFSF